jgi:hypothetical protein
MICHKITTEKTVTAMAKRAQDSPPVMHLKTDERRFFMMNGFSKCKYQKIKMQTFCEIF